MEKMKLRYAARSKKKEFGMLDNVILILVLIIGLVMLGLLIFRMLKKKENYENFTPDYDCRGAQQEISRLNLNNKFEEAQKLEEEAIANSCNLKA